MGSKRASRPSPNWGDYNETPIRTLLTSDRIRPMTPTTQATTATEPSPLDVILEDIAGAYDTRRATAEKLQRQDTNIGDLVRQARANGATWAMIAKHAKTSDVAVLKAARRVDANKKKAAG